MWKVFLVALIAVTCSVSSVSGQSTFGSIVGVVDDPSRSPVPGASVKLHNLDDGTVRTITSDQTGEFEFLNLQPGHYSLSVQAGGFNNFEVPSSTLEARQELRIDANLTIKSASATVEVTATAPTINTENGVLSDSKGTSQITQLPMNFRASTTSPLQAMTLSANVEQDSQGNMAVGGATTNMVGYSVDGVSTANIFLSTAGTNPYPSSEGIAELQVSAFDNSAEFSQVGDVTFTTKSGTNTYHGSLFEYLQNDALDAKVFNFSVKAPKRFNTFGGSLGGPVVLPKLYNRHSKTLFFFDYEGNRRRTSQPEQFLVPTQAEVSGNLTALASTFPVLNPTSGTVINPNCPQGMPCLVNPATGSSQTGQPYPGEANGIYQITNPLSQSSLTLLNDYYPLPNVNGNGYNYENLQSIPSSTNGFDGRIDRIISPKQQVYARFNWKNQVADVANPLLPNDVDSEYDRSFLISHSYSITSSLLNEFRFGFTHTLLSPSFPIEGAAAIAQLGFLDVNVSNHPTDGGFPSINFSNGTGFTPIGRDHVGSTMSSTNQITDNVTYIKGSHTFRSGVDLRWVRFAVPEIETPSDDYGLFTFDQDSVFTGSSFGDFLLGLPTTTYFAVTGPRNDAGALQTGLYGEDQWQVNTRLTVNLGLRWEWLPPFVDVHGIQANFDPETNVVLVNDNLYNALGGPVPAFLQSFNACNAAPPGFSDPADAGYAPSASLPCTAVVSNDQEDFPKGLRQTYLRNIDPRVSIAFRPFRNNKTVLRAGFGIYTVTNLGQLQNNNESNPEASVHTYVNGFGTNNQPLIQFPNTIAASQLVQIGGGTIEQATDPRYRDPQSAQWNLTVERELTSQTNLRVSYIGMNSYRMNVSVNWNQIPPSSTPYTIPAGGFVDPRAPFQNWGVIYSTENLGFQNYQALQLEATHKTSHGLFFQADYTWAHDISDAQGDVPTGFGGETNYGLAVVNRFDISADRGNVAGVRRQRFLLTGTYELPFGQGRRWSSSFKPLNAVVGGWNVNTITLLETGPYLTPTISCALDQSNTDPLGDGAECRPDLVGDPIPANRTESNYFNLNAFAPTPTNAGRIGNAGVGILEGPGTIAVNAGLSKMMQLNERLRLRFEATFTNVLNRVNFAPPATDVSSPSTFGLLDSAQTADYGGNRTGQLVLRLDF